MSDVLFVNCDTVEKQELARQWQCFLKDEKFDLSYIKKIDLSADQPLIHDVNNNKFCIDFEKNKTNYHKKKSSMKTELIGKAMGGGKYGLKVLDLSAGLGIDCVFLAQLGFEVTALERNPLIYLALSRAQKLFPMTNLNIVFADSADFLRRTVDSFDVIYFDPMFPEKNKSALPRQEMVFFKNLVGDDSDAAVVLRQAINFNGVKRVVVKRPMKASPLALKPFASINGKLIRFDLYGASKA